MPILADYGFVLGRWLVPLPATSLLGLPAIGWVGLLGLLLVVLWPRPSSQRELPTAPVPGVLLGSRMLFGSLLLSLLPLVYSAMRGRIRADVYEAERYLTPLYPPLVVLVLLRWPRRGAGPPAWARRCW